MNKFSRVKSSDNDKGCAIGNLFAPRLFFFFPNNNTTTTTTLRCATDIEIESSGENFFEIWTKIKKKRNVLSRDSKERKTRSPRHSIGFRFQLFLRDRNAHFSFSFSFFFFYTTKSRPISLQSGVEGGTRYKIHRVTERERGTLAKSIINF